MCHPARRQRSRHQLMSGAERSFVTVGFSWTLAKGFLQGERRAEFSRGSPRAGKGACEDGAASDDLGETPKALAEEARLQQAPTAAAGAPRTPCGCGRAVGACSPAPLHQPGLGQRF